MTWQMFCPQHPIKWHPAVDETSSKGRHRPEVKCVRREVCGGRTVSSLTLPLPLLLQHCRPGVWTKKGRENGDLTWFIRLVWFGSGTRPMLLTFFPV